MKKTQCGPAGLSLATFSASMLRKKIVPGDHKIPWGFHKFLVYFGI